MEFNVTLEPVSVVVLNKVIPPLEIVVKAGTPLETVKTCPSVPIPKREFVFAVEERYSIRVNAPKLLRVFRAVANNKTAGARTRVPTD